MVFHYSGSTSTTFHEGGAGILQLSPYYSMSTQKQRKVIWGVAEMRQT